MKIKGQEIFSLMVGKLNLNFITKKIKFNSLAIWLRFCSAGFLEKFAFNSYFYIEKWTFRIMCEVCYRAKRDKKEAT